MSRPRQQIFVEGENRSKLIEYFHISRVTLWYALNFKHNSALQRQIRSYAVNFLECPIILLEVNRL